MSDPQIQQSEPNEGELRHHGGSLAGRLRLWLVAALGLGVVAILGVSVMTEYRATMKRTQRAIPAALDAAEAQWRTHLRPGFLRLESAREALASAPSPAPAGVEPGLRWLPEGSGSRVPTWVEPGPEGLEMAPISEPWLAGLLPMDLLPEGATLATVPEDAQLGGPEAPAGGWPEEPMIYRNTNQQLVFGGSRAVPELGLRLVLELPFQSVFAPMLSVLFHSGALGLLLLALLVGLSRRIGESLMVGPIHALSEAATRVSVGQLDEPVSPIPAEAELALLTRTFNEMMGELARQRSDLQSANERLTQQNEDLQIANEVLGQLSITDGLTKLHNHRFFQDFLTREIKRVARTREHLSILVIDIDDFKRLNDQLGHAAGDELLVRLAEILNDAVRESDLVARYGGEEFVVLAPNTDEVGAFQLGEKVRIAVAEASFILDDTMRLVKMTVSIGVNTFRGSRKAFFTGADEALYQAKGDGKNCVVVAEAPLDDLD